jgi:hypothetical protein
MAKVLGSFYFKKNDSNTIQGKFANNDGKNESTTDEIAITTEKDNPINSFIGNYTATWYDTADRHAKLSIGFKFPSKVIYTLKWQDVSDGKTLFEGEGFLLDENTLIGFYKQL